MNISEPIRRTLLYGAHTIETVKRLSDEYALILNGKDTHRVFDSVKHAQTYGMDEIDKLIKDNRRSPLR